MASGDSLLIFKPQQNEQPTSNGATYDTRNNHQVLDFDDTTDEYAIFEDVLPRQYSGNGITVYIHYAMTSAVANAVFWSVEFERIGEGSLDIDSDGWSGTQPANGAATVPGTSGNVDIHNIPCLDGSEIANIAVGETFRIRVFRDANSGSDTAAGDAELIKVELKET